MRGNNWGGGGGGGNAFGLFLGLYSYYSGYCLYSYYSGYCSNQQISLFYLLGGEGGLG